MITSLLQEGRLKILGLGPMLKKIGFSIKGLKGKISIIKPSKVQIKWVFTVV